MTNTPQIICAKCVQEVPQHQLIETFKGVPIAVYTFVDEKCQKCGNNDLVIGVNLP